MRDSVSFSGLKMRMGIELADSGPSGLSYLRFISHITGGLHAHSPFLFKKSFPYSHPVYSVKSCFSIPS